MRLVPYHPTSHPSGSGTGSFISSSEFPSCSEEVDPFFAEDRPSGPPVSTADTTVAMAAWAAQTATSPVATRACPTEEAISTGAASACPTEEAISTAETSACSTERHVQRLQRRRRASRSLRQSRGHHQPRPEARGLSRTDPAHGAPPTEAAPRTDPLTALRPRRRPADRPAHGAPPTNADTRPRAQSNRPLSGAARKRRGAIWGRHRRRRVRAEDGGWGHQASPNRRATFR